MGYGNWDPVLDAGCWVQHLSLSLSRSLCFFLSLFTPISAQHIYFIRCLVFFASSCCGVERQPCIHMALPQTVNISRPLPRLFVLTNSLYEVELPRQLKAAVRMLQFACALFLPRKHTFFLLFLFCTLRPLKIVKKG